MSNKISDADLHNLLQTEQDDLQMELYYPNTGGAQHRPTILDHLQATAVQISENEAKSYWDKLYNFSFNKCQHLFWDTVCVSKNDCEVSIFLNQSQSRTYLIFNLISIISGWCSSLRLHRSFRISTKGDRIPEKYLRGKTMESHPPHDFRWRKNRWHSLASKK